MNIEKILKKHKKWLETKGQEGVFANLRDANLSRVNLRGVNLKMADLNRADLRDADLSGANLSRVNLRDANLSGANLSMADLNRADLRDADLSGANLSMATDFRGTNLSGANLRVANLRDANLSGATLRDANLSGAILPKYKIFPPSGSFLCWKKGVNGDIIKIQCPVCARRTSSLVGRKGRIEFGKVLEILDKNGNQKIESTGNNYPGIKYTVGQWVRPDRYDPDIRVECSHGIHVFLTFDEAVEWN